MLKKILLLNTLISLALFSTAYANGFYITTGLGYQLQTDDVQGNDVDGIVGTEFNVNIYPYGQGVVGVVSVGYDLPLVTHFGLAFEVNGEVSNASYNQHEYSTLNGTSEIFNWGEDYNGGVGISIRPAYIISERIKLYGIVGYEEGNFTNFANDALTSSTESVSSNYNNHVWSAGLSYGIGMEAALPTNIPLALGFEAVQARYGTSRFTNMEPRSTQTNYQHSPVLTEMVLRLVWKI